ncbi:mPR-like GPCR protein [Hypoxylon sp. FL0890]|nr:mPR-like GPCR protein [Hypoxylon sp. FL0890]
MVSQSTEIDADRDSSAEPRSSADEKQQSSFGSAEVLPRSSQSEKHKNSHRHSLVSFDEIPEWYQDNPYVRQGYRPVSHSARACFGSWMYVHNESMNIYTHLVPAAALLVSGIAYGLAYLQDRSSGDAGVVATLLLSAVACLGLSSAYHTLMCHSRQVEALWLRLDFVGIILLILGSFVSGIYVGFWCETLERKIYWSMIGSLAAISIIIVLAPTFQGPRWRTLRLLTFVCTGLSGLAPIIHGIVMFGFAQMMRQSGLPFYLAEGGLFLLGAIVYAVSWPPILLFPATTIYLSECRHLFAAVTQQERWKGVRISKSLNRA